jgi:hypothetical protein
VGQSGGRKQEPGSSCRHERWAAMNDVLYLGLTLGFFALSWVFIALCDRL